MLRCVALPIFVQKAEGPSLSLAGPPGLAVFLRDMDTDRRAKTEAELLLVGELELHVLEVKEPFMGISGKGIL